MKEEKKKIIKKYIFLFFILFIILTSVFIMIRYQVEGETDMPYHLKQVVLKSTIGSENIEGKSLWNLELSQNNDIYIYIEPNDNIEKDEKIEKVCIENIKIEGLENTDNIQILLPTGKTLDDIYDDSTKDYKKEKIEFIGNTADSLDRHEICEDGGMIALRIANNKIGNYESNEDKVIKYDGSLLEKAGISEESLKFKVSLDIIIETSSGINYKSSLEYELPVGDFQESGTNTKVIEDFSNVIFKRE